MISSALLVISDIVNFIHIFTISKTSARATNGEVDQEKAPSEKERKQESAFIHKNNKNYNTLRICAIQLIQGRFFFQFLSRECTFWYLKFSNLDEILHGGSA